MSFCASAKRGERALRNRLRQQLKATQRLSRLLDEADHAAARLRSAARWPIANPVSTLKSKLSPRKSRHLLGYGHLEKIVSTYESGEPPTPRLWQLMTKSKPCFQTEFQLLYRRQTPSGHRQPCSLNHPVPTRPIEFQVHQRVEVSIIIPVFTSFVSLKRVLLRFRSIRERNALRLLWWDDCSTDGTAESVPPMPGVVYLRNGNQFGFHRLL